MADSHREPQRKTGEQHQGGQTGHAKQGEHQSSMGNPGVGHSTGQRANEDRNQQTGRDKHHDTGHDSGTSRKSH